MSLPPYKHTRNPCLQTEDEPLIPGLSGAPLITYKCVREKRRTSDQRVARIQNIPGVEFEYEYVPASSARGSQVGLLSREKMISKPQIEDHHYQQHQKIKSVDLKYANEQSPPGASGDQPSAGIKNIDQCTARNYTCNNIAEKSNDQRNLDDAKSTCSRLSSISNCSRNSRKTNSSSKGRKSGHRCDSRESLSSTLNAVLKSTPSREQKKCEELCFQKFGKIANGLDDDDLRPRRR